MPSRALLSTTTLGCALALFGAAHAVMELASRYAENELGAYLWHREEYQQLMTKASWVGRGRGRVLLCGPSEAREAFCTEVFEEALPGADVYSMSQSWGTLADFLLMLELVERSYGPDALPDRIVLGTTPRWLSNLGVEISPVVRAIDRESPDFRVSVTPEGLELAPKGLLEGLVSRYRHRKRQTSRYQGAVWAFAREAARCVGSEWAESAELEERLDPYRFARRPPRGSQLVQRFVEEPRGLYVELQRWDAREHRAEIERDVDRLIELCKRNDVRLYVVNLPIRPTASEYYDDELYDAYLEVLREALGSTPFVDLTDLLSDEEFFDSVHPSGEGAERVSLAACELVVGAGAREEPGP